MKREPHGRVMVNARTGRQSRRLQVAMLRPAFESDSGERWHFAAERAGEALTNRKITIRPVDFVHWDDPVLAEVLGPAKGGDGSDGSGTSGGGGYDGILLLPPAEAMPQVVLQKVLATPTPLVVLGRDLTEHGLFGIDPCPPDQFRKLFDHLYDLGHRRIDLLNTQPRTTGIDARFEQWRLWREENGVAGESFDRPVRSYENAMIAAYDLARELIREGRLGSAVFCATTAAAMGVIRAAHEQGLSLGRDISVCGADDEGFARFTVPSITTLSPPSAQPFLAEVLAWMAAGGRAADWPGGPRHADRLITSDDVPLYVGESTGPRARSENTHARRGAMAELAHSAT